MASPALHQLRRLADRRRSVRRRPGTPRRSGVARITVDYDPTYGYPRSIVVDVAAMAADDEYSQTAGICVRCPELSSSWTSPAEFVAQSRRYLASEYPTKIQRCLDVLPADAIWRRDDDASNSIGNLLLHLSGNIRQWIVSGVGGAPDARHRRAEFDAREGDDARCADGSACSTTVREADAVLASLDAVRLAELRTIQGRDVTVLDAVYHVVEHFSMHTGQIILLDEALRAGPRAVLRGRGRTRPPALLTGR